MSKKKLNTSAIENELEGASLYFAKPEATPPPDGQESRERSIERKSEPTEERTDLRPVGLPVKRLARRYSFEFYDDQIVNLKKLKHEAEMKGEKITLSDIVRGALDEYLKEK